LKDWLDLAKQLETEAVLEICPLGEIGSRKPDVIEAFAIRHGKLTDATFPTRKEHELVNRFSDYWPAVEQSEVPAIGVIKGTPNRYPVFVRGEQGTFAGGGLVRTSVALNRLRQSDRSLVIRPWVEIHAADRRPAVKLELRVQVVAGRTAAVEYLFPPWATQRPTEQELYMGQDWTESNREKAAQYAERIAKELTCRWFVADFAETIDGLRLIELNPGWCSGIAHSDTARSVHLAILGNVFQTHISTRSNDH
jgi:hypothetical protein